MADGEGGFFSREPRDGAPALSCELVNPGRGLAPPNSPTNSPFPPSTIPCEDVQEPPAARPRPGAAGVAATAAVRATRSVVFRLPSPARRRWPSATWEARRPLPPVLPEGETMSVASEPEEWRWWWWWEGVEAVGPCFNGPPPPLSAAWEGMLASNRAQFGTEGDANIRACASGGDPARVGRAWGVGDGEA